MLSRLFGYRQLDIYLLLGVRVPLQHAVAETPVAADPSTLDYIKALSPLAVPATALIVLLIVIFLVSAIACRWFEVDASWGKLVFKVRRPDNSRTTQIHQNTILDEAIVMQSNVVSSDVVAQAAIQLPEEQASGQPNFAAYFEARSLRALDEAFEPFRSTIAAEDMEFWETNYRKRRAEYGADNGRDEMRKLIEENPTWAFPHAVLLKWHLEDHDFEEAEVQLQVGLKKKSSAQFGRLLSEGVTLRYRRNGTRNAVSFCAEWSKAQIPEWQKAGAFGMLAELLKEDGEIEGYRVALEWALAVQPADKSKEFPLAYSYAENPGHWPPAMWHYQRVFASGNDGTVASNNLAILIGHFDKMNQIEGYERAAQGGDQFSVANLAHLLISDGYVLAAERLLKSVADPGSAAELHASAAAAAHAARRAMETKRREIEIVVDKQSASFRHSLARALRHLQSGLASSTGFYASDDELIVVELAGDSAACRARFSSLDYAGTLKYQGGCYAGLLLSKGQTFLNTYTTEVTLLEEGGGAVRLFQWPSSIGAQSVVNDYLLKHVESPPEPPPPFSSHGGLTLGRLFEGERDVG